MIKLTSENYFSPEANRSYWSASLVKEFMDCPSRALATLNGQYQRESSTALLVGSYVDAHFESAADQAQFILNHPEIVKKDGTLKADYVLADEMIQRAESDKVFMEYMEGEKQRIFTGDIGGFPFKAKFDVYLPGKRIVDLKTVRDMEPVYKPGQGKLDFASAWNWPLQLAIYQALEGNKLPCYLAVITKENPPALEIVEIPQDVLDAELEFLLTKMPMFDAIKSGIVEPERCEKCAWCRQSKVLTGPRSLNDFRTEE